MSDPAAPDETERVAPGSAAYWERRCHEAWAKGDQDAHRILELKSESAHQKRLIAELRQWLSDARTETHVATVRRDAAERQLQEALETIGALPLMPDSTPADRGPLTPHPPPWPIDGVLTSPKPGQNFDIDDEKPATPAP